MPAAGAMVGVTMTGVTRMERGTATRLCALALAALALAAAPEVGAQQASVGGQARAPQRQDTSGVRAELEAARRALAASEARIRALAASLAGREVESATIDSIVRLQREHQQLAGRVRLLEARSRFRATEVEVRRQVAPARPQGWFGVNVTTVTGAGVSQDGRVLVAADYPVIRSVEPGSPAARAGLQAGDRIVTILGHDLRRESVDLARVLRPGTTVPVHIVRDGRPLDVAVSITARPSSFGPARIEVSAEPPSPAAAPRPPRPGERPRTVVRAPQPPEPGAAPTPTVYWLSNTRVAPVAGAEVMTLTQGLRRTHGVEGGIFVVSVLPRTPADAAGLEPGDVLVRADGARLDEPMDFLRVVRSAASGERKVTIELVREKRARTVEMRW